MIETSIPIIAVSTTADSTHEHKIPRAITTPPPKGGYMPGSVPESSAALQQRAKDVPARKARTFQNGNWLKPRPVDGPSEMDVLSDAEDDWVIHSILSAAGACLLTADDFFSARMIATLLSECCAQQRNVGGLHVRREVSMFHAATTRMNTVDQKLFDQWNDPANHTFSKNYANSRYPHMPIRTQGLSSRIRDDFDAALAGC